MPSVIKCGTCGGIIKTFNDDCQVCLGNEKPPKKEEELTQKDTDFELLFNKEREKRLALEAKLARNKDG
jgi:hypothetical protein